MTGAWVSWLRVVCRGRMHDGCVRHHTNLTVLVGMTDVEDLVSLIGRGVTL